MIRAKKWAVSLAAILLLIAMMPTGVFAAEDAYITSQMDKIVELMHDGDFESAETEAGLVDTNADEDVTSDISQEITIAFRDAVFNLGEIDDDSICTYYLTDINNDGTVDLITEDENAETEKRELTAYLYDESTGTANAAGTVEIEDTYEVYAYPGQDGIMLNQYDLTTGIGAFYMLKITDDGLVTELIDDYTATDVNQYVLMPQKLTAATYNYDEGTGTGILFDGITLTPRETTVTGDDSSDATSDAASDASSDAASDTSSDETSEVASSEEEDESSANSKIITVGILLALAVIAVAVVIGTLNEQKNPPQKKENTSTKSKKHAEKQAAKKAEVEARKKPAAKKSSNNKKAEAPAEEAVVAKTAEEAPAEVAEEAAIEETVEAADQQTEATEEVETAEEVADVDIDSAIEESEN